MSLHSLPDFTLMNALAAIFIAIVFIILGSLFKEPKRQNFMAIMIGGAGAAYLNGGLGYWEFAFCALITFLAYKGLKRYYYIGIGWLLHAGWDILHHLFANPIVPFSPSSSAGCAVTDTILAVWFFFHAPSVFDLFNKYKTQPLKIN